MTSTQLPEKISRLRELSRNLWWSWTPKARELFRYLDHQLWESTHHNPPHMLTQLTDEQINWAKEDTRFLELYDEVFSLFDNSVHGSTNWFSTQGNPFISPVAYFSMEFGLHQSIPIYSGGLGILAGDIFKEASDLGIPFVGVGFMYHQGYFTQNIPLNGWQEAQFKKIDFNTTCLFPVINDNGQRIKVTVNLGTESIFLQAWYINVGRNRLFLLDTDINENKPWYRSLSSRLYGGDHEMRLNQEIILGFGGTQLLETLGITPSKYHLNEGHCTFVSLRRLHKLVIDGMGFQEAISRVRKTTVFTTHTPVPAGHDTFDLDQIIDKFDGIWDEMGISKQEFLQLGIDGDISHPRYNMTVLGFKTAHIVNGVSKLHTKVTQQMWSNLLQNDETDTKLIPVTNGIHILTWISGPMRQLLSKYVDPHWIEKIGSSEIWQNVKNIPNEEFWKTKIEAKRKLFSYIRETARKFQIDGAKTSVQLLASGVLFNPEVLTIGFARRFATYKRANLIFRELNTLRDIINNSDRPVQIIFAGKAHPADDHGKYILQQIYQQALDFANGGRIAFIENYDMQVAKYLVQGVDLWLNNPIRSQEASGTSGIKASINGAPHFSVLDGWWQEGYKTTNGWVIGIDEIINEEDRRDDIDAESLYNTLKNDIVPKYYNKNNHGIPNAWVEICKEAIRTVAPNFSASRMVKDYTLNMYLK